MSSLDQFKRLFPLCQIFSILGVYWLIITVKENVKKDLKSEGDINALKKKKSV